MNKLYNAAKFILMNTDNYTPCLYEEVQDRLTLADQWIISKMNQLALEIDANMEKYEFGIAAEKLYDFAWNTFVIGISSFRKQRCITKRMRVKNRERNTRCCMFFRKF